MRPFTVASDPRLNVLAATLESTGKIPVAGLAIIYGVDRLMSEIRTLTNFIGNTVGTLVIAKWDGALVRRRRGRSWRRNATLAD